MLLLYFCVNKSTTSTDIHRAAQAQKDGVSLQRNFQLRGGWAAPLWSWGDQSCAVQSLHCSPPCRMFHLTSNDGPTLHSGDISATLAQCDATHAQKMRGGSGTAAISLFNAVIECTPIYTKLVRCIPTTLNPKPLVGVPYSACFVRGENMGESSGLIDH